MLIVIRNIKKNMTMTTTATMKTKTMMMI